MSLELMVASSDKEIVARFYDHELKREDIYLFSGLSLDTGIQKSLCEAFIDLTGHYNRRSRRQAWRSINKFAKYLKFENRNLSLDTEFPRLLDGFARFLRKFGLLNKTNGSHFNFCRSIIVWLKESKGDTLWSSQLITKHSFKREEACPRDVEISKELLKKIANACKKEIKEIKEALAIREAISSGEKISKNMISKDEIDHLKELIDFESKDVWTQRELGAERRGRLGAVGLRRLAIYRELTIRTALPIYLLLMIETAGNPVALMELKLDCLQEHPTDKSMVILRWFKGRGSKEQALSFIKEGKFSPSNLIEIVKNYTKPIRHLADEADQDLLFITRTGRKAKRLSVQSMHNALKVFREKHGIPDFNFCDIRKSVASLLYLNAYSVKEIGAFLAHKDIKTTSLYLKSKEATSVSYERLHGFQGEMIYQSTKINVRDYEFTTMFGMACKNPSEGRLKEVKHGEVCFEYISCATCPNAIVVIDSPLYVARILKSKEALLETKKRLLLTSDGIERFKGIYEETLVVINRDILPKVNNTVLEEATRLAKDLPDVPYMV